MKEGVGFIDMWLNVVRRDDFFMSEELHLTGKGTTVLGCEFVRKYWDVSTSNNGLFLYSTCLRTNQSWECVRFKFCLLKMNLLTMLKYTNFCDQVTIGKVKSFPRHYALGSHEGLYGQCLNLVSIVRSRV